MTTVWSCGKINILSWLLSGQSFFQPCWRHFLDRWLHEIQNQNLMQLQLWLLFDGLFISRPPTTPNNYKYINKSIETSLCSDVKLLFSGMCVRQKLIHVATSSDVKYFFRLFIICAQQSLIDVAIFCLAPSSCIIPTVRTPLPPSPKFVTSLTPLHR